MHTSFINSRDEYQIHFPKGVPHFVKSLNYNFQKPLMKSGKTENEIIFFLMSNKNDELLIGEEEGKWFCFKIKDDHHHHVSKFFDSEHLDEVQDIDDDMFDCYEIEITSPLHFDFNQIYRFDLETKALFTFANHDIFIDNHYILDDLHLKIYRNINISLDKLRYDCDIYIIKPDKKSEYKKFFSLDEQRVMIFKFKGVDSAIILKFRSNGQDLCIESAEYIELQIDDEIHRMSINQKTLENYVRLMSGTKKSNKYEFKLSQDYRQIKDNIKNLNLKPSIEFY